MKRTLVIMSAASYSAMLVAAIAVLLVASPAFGRPLEGKGTSPGHLRIDGNRAKIDA